MNDEFNYWVFNKRTGSWQGMRSLTAARLYMMFNGFNLIATRKF